MTGLEESSIPRTRRHTRMFPPRLNLGDVGMGIPTLQHHTPRSYGGLACWFRADSWSGPSNSDVGQDGREWNDSSLSGRLLDRHETNLPRWQQEIDGSQPGIFFDSAFGMRLIMPSILNLTGDFTFLCVYKQDLSNDGVIVSHSGQNRQLRANRGDANRNSYYDGTVEVISDILSVTQTSLKAWWVTRSGSGSNNILHSVNKTSSGTGTSTTTLDVNLIGGGNIGNVFGGWLLELAIWTQARTVAERDYIYDNYLRLRYPSLP